MAIEASWRGCSLHLDKETLTLRVAEKPPVQVPLVALDAFTVVVHGPVVSDRPQGVATPDGELLLSWRGEGGKVHHARVPVPTEALQVQLFLARLSQLRPEADLRALPRDEAQRRMGLPPPPRATGRLRPFTIAAVALAALCLLAFAAYLIRT